MSAKVRVSRIAKVPDRLRLERCLRLPELGPRILFFSGGSALRAISELLKSYTHNSIHLITPFDSGGSSAKLRDAFHMLAVGDLRNRLMALADDSVKGNPDIYSLFSHRLDQEQNPDVLRAEIMAMVSGEHELVIKLDLPVRQIVRNHLREFVTRMPPEFDLRDASIGNLILAGGYLAADGDILSVLFLFSRLVEVRGIVRPIVEDDCHLAARLRGGDALIGQHRITHAHLESMAVEELYLVDSQVSALPVVSQISAEVASLVTSADLICYPVGSFYTSVVANLLPQGVGRAIVDSRCPKIYIPNVGADPEQEGMSVADSLRAIAHYVRRDAGEEIGMDRIIDMVLLDTESAARMSSQEREGLADTGVEIITTSIRDPSDAASHDPTRVVEALLSLA